VREFRSLLEVRRRRFVAVSRSGRGGLEGSRPGLLARGGIEISRPCGGERPDTGASDRPIRSRAAEEEEEAEKGESIDETLKCPFCHLLCERPVSSQCGHNYCIKVSGGCTGLSKEAPPVSAPTSSAPPAPRPAEE